MMDQLLFLCLISFFLSTFNACTQDVLVRSEKTEDHKDFSMLIFTSSPSSKSKGFEFLGRAKSSDGEGRTVEISSLER